MDNDQKNTNEILDNANKQELAELLHEFIDAKDKVLENMNSTKEFCNMINNGVRNFTNRLSIVEQTLQVLLQKEKNKYPSSN